MKKIIILISLMIVVLTGCGNTYEQATVQPSNKDYANGYFTEVYKWEGEEYYHIVYANDTKVMYFIIEGTHCNSGITPLYNADGSLQIYKGEQE